MSKQEEGDRDGGQAMAVDVDAEFPLTPARRRALAAAFGPDRVPGLLRFNVMAGHAWPEAEEGGCNLVLCGGLHPDEPVRLAAVEDAKDVTVSFGGWASKPEGPGGGDVGSVSRWSLEVRGGRAPFVWPVRLDVRVQPLEGEDAEEATMRHCRRAIRRLTFCRVVPLEWAQAGDGDGDGEAGAEEAGGQ